MPDNPIRLDVRHAVAALVVGAIVGAALAVVVGTRDETFQSRTVLAIDQPLAIATSGNGGIVEKLSRLRGKYAGLVRTDVIAEPVAERTELPVGAVRGSLVATADDTSLLLVVGARSPHREQARTLASVAAEELVRYADEEQASYQIPEAQRFTFEVVVPASNPSVMTPQRPRQLRVGVVGLVVGAVLVYAALQLLALERRR